jgi:hypothetical protein
MTSSTELSPFLNTISQLAPGVIILKFLRRSKRVHLLTQAFQEMLHAMPVLVYMWSVIALIFSTLLFVVEREENIPTFGHAVWVVLVTMFTVGYGDYHAGEAAGKAVTSVLMFVSCMYLAVPIGIIGTTFSRVWDDRERLMAMHKVREHIHKAGYTPLDMYDMFAQLDNNGNNELSLDEFAEMMPMMNLDMTASVCRQIFESFMDQASGTMDFRDFLRGIYPHTHKVAMTHKIENRLNQRYLNRHATSQNPFKALSLGKTFVIGNNFSTLGAVKEAAPTHSAGNFAIAVEADKSPTALNKSPYNCVEQKPVKNTVSFGNDDGDSSSKGPAAAAESSPRERERDSL